MSDSNALMQNEIAWSPSQNLMVLKPAMELEVALQRMRDFRLVVKKYMIEGQDYGKIPGTDKPTLFKPGADKFCDMYGLTDTYEIIYAERDWSKGLFAYEIRCLLHYRGTDVLVCSGVGSCSTWEGKFRWRSAKRLCPSCQCDAIIKGKKEYGGGWICFKKNGGCGDKFGDNDERIVSQEVGRIENPDIHDQINNVLKSAKKRAKVDAVLSATRSSGLFTQDMEDQPPEDRDHAQGYVIAGKVEDYKTRPDGVSALMIKNNDGKAWKVIAHELVATEIDGLIIGKMEHGEHPYVELDCVDAIAPNGKSYIKAIRTLKIEAQTIEAIPYADDDGLISKCSKHGVYSGEGNCPGCEGKDQNIEELLTKSIKMVKDKKAKEVSAKDIQDVVQESR